jgi:malic enzyme
VGKIDLYVAAGGFNPGRVLPCVIDVGTDNAALREDPCYIGLTQPRVRGAEYYAIVDEFVDAVMGRWPNAVLQFEDFSLEHAQPLLERYRHHWCVFNDDQQGTAATAVAGESEAAGRQRCGGTGDAGDARGAAGLSLSSL